MAKQPESRQILNDPAPRSQPQKVVVSVPDLEREDPKSNRRSSTSAEAQESRLTTVAPSASKARPRNTTTPPSQMAVTVDELDADEHGVSVTDRIHRNRKPLSSFLVSMIVHLTMILVLALLVFSRPNEAPLVSVIAEIDATPAPEEAMTDIEKVEIVAEEEEESPIEMNAADLSTDIQELAPQEQNSMVQLPSEFNNPTEATDLAPEAPNQLLPTGGGLEGRDSQARSRLAAARGGSRASEEAVERGLKWIIEHQHQDGSWRLMHNHGQCQGRCQNEGLTESTTAATGLSLLALLGAGYTNQVGPYQSEIQSGLDYLIARIRVNRYGGNLAEGSMYAQGIATLALSEALIMTRDERLREPTEQAMRYILSAQHSAGGWRYNPGQPGDMTVTGWQLMALKSCARAGFEFPREHFAKARSFLDSKGESGGAYYGYLAPGMDPSPTAIGLLCQMYLGWPKEKGALFTGAERIADWGPSKTDVYFNYYATQVLHHLDTELWEDWNPRMRDYLVRTQETKGHQEGSWFFKDKHGRKGGRLYTTAMSVMILEVYYRYLPLYDENAVD